MFRLHHIYDFIVIHVLLNLLPTDLKQIVEYGCGTSDVGPMLRQLGFKGAHLMYDIYHVTLMQRYFLRYSGYPVYMVGTLAGMNSTYGSVQVPVHTGMLNTAIDRSSEILKKSLFMATFSLTETPIHERDRITSMIDDFAIIYIRSALRFDNVDNSEYLSRLSRELVGKGYTYCFIEGGELRQEIIITFLAVRLDSLGWVSEDFFSRCQSEETIFWARFS